ncbi:nucleoside hydrolase [Fictibacillus phosphorivorans]|uniref:nucleoside hydrolase n=1 Tax=Fictibacillus phosphorivorans TaxID=1221500 RepID=UPI0020424371|nr:nucleoside hydrolase [Fictibacillus phosphorivorans]MCM3720292.1 nucleoside hydrolase [Fictibacillus phosphorivorans]MCM3777982.1 nucleoside hydrolase [Fictibacillus phosphorivorans]
MYNVLIFCDPGIDDSLSIMYALLNPEIQVVGIVSSYGNVDQQQATQNIAYLLQLANRQDVPIIAGARSPFSGEIAVYYPEIHGEEGLGPIQPPDTVQREVLNFDEIFKIIKKYENNLIVVDVGRSTSLATAFILGGDEQMSKISAFYIMGGAFLVPGNVTPLAEANFHGDAIASNLVLNKAKNVYIFPLNVTNYAIIKPETINVISSATYNEFSPLIKPIFDFYNEAYKKLVPGIEGSPLHDVLPLFALTHPDQVRYVNRKATVSINMDATKGLSEADFRPLVPQEPPEEVDHLANWFNYQAFVQDFIETMTTRVNRLHYKYSSPFV